jgi:hypothetical protein
LDGRVDFEQHISEMTEIHSVLRFYVKMWCQSHLYGCYWRNTIIQPGEDSSENPNNMIIYFVSFQLSIVYLFLILNFSYWMSFSFMLYFFLLFNLNYFKLLHFYSLWNLTMKKSICVLLILQNKYLLEILK